MNEYDLTQLERVAVVLARVNPWYGGSIETARVHVKDLADSVIEDHEKDGETHSVESGGALVLKYSSGTMAFAIASHLLNYLDDIEKKIVIVNK